MSSLTKKRIANFKANKRGYFSLWIFSTMLFVSLFAEFLANDKPIYVGISRNVINRLRQHVRGKTHFDASLAYRIAKKNFPHDLTRADAMKNDVFKAEFDNAKEYISGLKVAFVEIENPLVLYFFEAYCAMYFDTFEWNTFKTH